MTTLLLALAIVATGPKSKDPDAPATIARTMVKYGHPVRWQAASKREREQSIAGRLIWSKYPERWAPGDEVLVYDFGSREFAEIQGESALAATPKEGLAAVTAGRFYYAGPSMRVAAVSQTLREAGLKTTDYTFAKQ